MIGYAVYYKDKDGYEIILDDLGKILVFANEKIAIDAMNIERDKAYNLFHSKKIIKNVGHLWWKKTIVENIIPNEIDIFNGRQIYNTIGIKRVKIV